MIAASHQPNTPPSDRCHPTKNVHRHGPHVHEGMLWLSGCSTVLRVAQPAANGRPKLWGVGMCKQLWQALSIAGMAPGAGGALPQREMPWRAVAGLLDVGSVPEGVLALSYDETADCAPHPIPAFASDLSCASLASHATLLKLFACCTIQSLLAQYNSLKLTGKLR
eukprot:SAG11_NODE_12381_length_706_cov_1.023064_1_plen_165_part_10